MQKLVASIDNRRLVTYGTNPQAMVRAENVEMGPDGCRFDVVIQNGETHSIENLHLPMAGWHNVSNALAAIAVARELDVSDEAIRTGLAGFGGVKRRFTTTGVVNGVRIVDDYGHHPVEIAAVLKAARQVTEGRVIAVVQPHRYTRLRDLMDEFSTSFSDADSVIVADVYPAGEQPIEGVDKHALADGVRRYGHRQVQALENAAVLPRLIKDEARPGGRGRAAGRRRHHQLGLRPAGAAGDAGVIALPEVRGKLLRNEALAPYTWFRVGGAADALFIPADADDLAAFLKALAPAVPVTVLGVGSNVIVRDGGVEGVVIRLAGRAWGQVTTDGLTITAGAGALDAMVARAAAKAGIAGLEFYAGIPRRDRRRPDHERGLLRRRNP